MNKQYSLDPNESYVIELLRIMKRDKNTRGHGRLEIEIADGVETFFRPHYSYQAPMKKISC